MPPTQQYTMTVAAAAVTYLRNKRRDSVPDATAEVAKLTGIDEKKIKSFRNNINSGTAPMEAMKAYPAYVAEIETWPDLQTLKGLAKFL